METGNTISEKEYHKLEDKLKKQHKRIPRSAAQEDVESLLEAKTREERERKIRSIEQGINLRNRQRYNELQKRRAKTKAAKKSKKKNRK